jgi:outer membrane protein OmpA-like peptidoglycan-associated protein
MTRISILAVGAAAVALAACTTPDGTRDRTATGALLGAAGGAALGQAIRGDSRGTLIGAASGAALGGLLGRQLDAQAAELERNLQGTGAYVVNTGSELIVTLPEAITFDFGSAALRPQFTQPLFGVSQSLQNYPNTAVVVIGHTDNVGSRQYNQGLSERRAQSVANVLIQGGTAPGRIRTLGRAFDQPIASNETEAGRAQNRRVEIVITPQA